MANAKNNMPLFAISGIMIVYGLIASTGVLLPMMKYLSTHKSMDMQVTMCLIVGAIGLIGETITFAALLFWTVISLLTKVEQAFNAVWQVPDVRGWARRFSDYLSVLLVGPLLVFSALGATASLTSHTLVQRLVHLPVLSWVVETVGALVPYLLVIAAFAFITWLNIFKIKKTMSFIKIS